MASDRDAFPCDTTLKAQTPHSTDFITLHIIRQAVRRGCASVSTASQFWLHLPLHGSSSPVQAANVVFHLPAAWRCKPYPASKNAAMASSSVPNRHYLGFHNHPAFSYGVRRWGMQDCHARKEAVHCLFCYI